MTEFGNCGNCNYGCCCKCSNPECRPCRREQVAPPACMHFGSDRRVLCFGCRRLFRRSDPMTRICSCGSALYLVSTAVRIPKAKDCAGWRLMEKLVTCCDIMSLGRGTRGYLWRTRGTIGCKQHLSTIVRQQIWVPQTEAQYRRWIEEMKLPLEGG